MKVVTKKINDYDAIIYNTKRYSTIHIDYVFLSEFTLENYIKFDLLDRYMLNTNSKYKTRKAIEELQTNYYSFGAMLHISNYCDDLVIKFSLELINPKLVKDDYFDDLFKEIHTLLFKPNFKDGKLNKKIVNLLKKEMINNYESRITNIFRLAESDFNKSVFNNTYYTRIDCSLEEYKRIVNGITDQDIINTYNVLINESFKKMFIMGDITDSNLESLKKIKFKNITDKELTLNIPKINPINDYVEFKFKGKESTIRVLYEVKDYNTIKDRLYLTTFVKILNNSGRILHNIYRNKLKIVYYSGAYKNHIVGYILIEADIDAKNKEKFIEGLDLVFDEFKNKELIEEALSNYKKVIKDTLYTLEEDKWEVRQEFLDKYLYNDFIYEDLYESLKNMNYNDMIQILNRLERRIIHFAKATDN